MRKITCPKCGKSLLRIEPYKPGVYEFWCDDCDIDVEFTNNREIYNVEVTQCVKLEATFINQELTEEDIKKRLDADDIRIMRNKIFKFPKNA